MNDFSLPPQPASVLYLRFVEFAQQPLPEQQRLRAQLDARVTQALQGLPLADRLVLEAADGMIVVVLDNPAGALVAAQRCLQGAEALPLGIGLNHGPVAPVSDKGAVAGIDGDGIADAAVAAGFASAGELLATRDFRDVLVEQAPARDTELRSRGMYTDARLRRHELWTLAPQAAVQRRKRLRTIAAGGALALLLLAFGLRFLLATPAVLVFNVTPSGKVYVDGRHEGATPPLQRLELRSGRHVVEVRHVEHPTLRREVDLKAGEQMMIRHSFAPPGLLLFDVLPGGEIFVDGLPQGHLPGLTQLELSSTEHRIDIYYESYPPLTVNLALQPGQQAVIRHRFEPEAPPAEPPADPAARKPKGKR